MHGNNEFFNISDDIIYYGGLVWDSIDRGRGGEGISGGKAAPDGVATEGILVNEEGDGGCVIRPYLLKIIMNIYGFRFDIYYCRGDKRRSTTTA